MKSTVRGALDAVRSRVAVAESGSPNCGSLYFLEICATILPVGSTNEAETRRCAARPAIYCLDRTPSFLAGITVTFKQGPESKLTGRMFHRQEKYDG